MVVEHKIFRVCLRMLYNTNAITLPTNEHVRNINRLVTLQLTVWLMDMSKDCYIRLSMTAQAQLLSLTSSAEPRTQLESGLPCWREPVVCDTNITQPC